MADEITETPLPLPLPLQHLQLRLRALNNDILEAVKARHESTQRQAVVVDTPEAEGSERVYETAESRSCRVGGAQRNPLIAAILGRFGCAPPTRQEPSRTPSESMAGASLLMQVVQALNPQSRVCISDAQVDFLISEVKALCQGEGISLSEQELRAEAKREGIVLPLDRLEFELPLSPTQMDGVVLCAAPEFDSAYEILFAFILNDISRRLPCPELFCALSGEIRDRFDRRLELGRFGRLRLLGVVVPQGTSSSELRQELRLAPDSSTSCSTVAAIPRTSVATGMKSSCPLTSVFRRTSTAIGWLRSDAH